MRITRERRADHKPRSVLIAWHILKRMHRGVESSVKHRFANLRHEGSTFASMRQELADLVDIARCLEFDDFDLGADGIQASCDLLSLGDRHRAFARADPQSIRSNTYPVQGRATSVKLRCLPGLGNLVDSILSKLLPSRPPSLRPTSGL